MLGCLPHCHMPIVAVATRIPLNPQLESLNQEVNASRFISGPGEVPNDLTGSTELSPLAGNWRLLWTTASDVLSLGASPFLTVGAIYQLFDPPLVTNVIDLLPRVQNLLPPSLVANSQLRAEVQTRASPRKDKPMRIRLDFEKVTLKPVDLLGQDVGSILPPFGFDLPKLFELPDDVGYFDVTFLDAELVIIRQNAPGGCFVLTQVEDSGNGKLTLGLRFCRESDFQVDDTPIFHLEP